ncbi:MAG TPA: FeoA family protein [candidate division Zixibacteria bacterium]|nr:ferrous iron transport protein A [candidate division Zixibacteria bacterium]MDD4917869.1 FeoA family protein [candidate division Zixibacteria bacterium]MDM7973519.1 FeoA family protein [candidate division Zixibacteria bacterium]HOD67461.1 FeoA family protein [candidate division Zixibacteria bacterium]HOZ08287.1 FeoA family protein [candidate division Zixibacteria bacterium]
MTYLSRMSPGQRGRIVGFVDDSPLARRLLELGIIPGRLITYLRNAPLSDPMQVQVGSSCLTLRHQEASLVAVEPEE